ncbi:MAG: ABC transporter ATP-binding protein [Pseudomonadota bacterium]|nr:ABC transporter ATP-binding protein [Pseudomonadota bacterium]
MSQPLSMSGVSIDLKLTAGRFAVVRDVDLSVGAGEIVCLVGESGSGKTITALAAMRLLPRVARMRSASVVIDGTETRDMSDKAFGALLGDRVSIVFQNPMSSLNPVLTIGEQLCEAYLTHKRGSRAEAEARAIDLLERVGVSAAADRMRQYPHQLSGGLRQRVMIALAFMCEPALVIGDEPTTALDVTMQAQTLRLLKDLARDTGIGLLLITHDLGVVSRMADRVVVMYAGRVVEEGTCDEIFAHPIHPYTRGLVDCAPAHATSGGFLSIPGEVPALSANPVGCDFRNRCPSARADCHREPPMRQESTRRWRCVMDRETAQAAPTPARAALEAEG